MIKNNKKKGFLEKLTYKYRLLVINENTFEQRASIRLSRMNIYAVLSALFLVIALIVFAIIAYTPIKYYLPGMEFTDRRGELMALQYRTDSLAEVLETQQIWITNYRRILGDDLDSAYYDVGSRESINPDSVKPAVVSESEQDLRRKMEREELFALQTSGSSKNWEMGSFHNPAEGLIVGFFDRQNGHFGIDIAAPLETPIKAVRDGVVLSAEWNLESGHTIVIQHKDDVVSFYRHNASLLKEAGEIVKSGEAIALLGNSGELTTGPHLHFELWKQGQALNPENLLTLELVK